MVFSSLQFIFIFIPIFFKIYLMLGVNELGYKFEKIIEKYKELIQFIKEKKPNITIFLQANLHITSERSNSDDTLIINSSIV